MIRSSYPKTTKDNALKINMNGTEKSARERRSRTKESRYKEPKSSAVSGRTSANMSNSLFSGILSERDRKPLLSSTVPTMKEINEVKGSNGLRFLSTFTGSGGSELGFLSAGWQNVGCVEFLKSGRDTIMLNDPELFSIEPDLICIRGSRVYEELGGEESLGFKLHKNTARTDKGVKFAPSINWDETHFQITTSGDKSVEEKFSEFRSKVNDHMFSLVPEGRKPLWGDDIRGFDPYVFMEHTGLKPGELDLAEGSPPCKSFSMSGLRNAAWGKVVKYTDERNERTDSLFFEFYRIIAAFMPRAFVAENVVGIMYGKARDSFLIPLRETFTELGYNVEVRKIKAEEHGVPQSRHRAIFQGIRKDNIDLRNHRSASPEWPETNPYVYNVQDVLEASDELNTPEYIESASVEGREIGKIWDALFPGTSSKSKTFQAQKVDPNFPMPTITAEETRNIGGAGALHPTEKRKFTLPEYKYAFTFPEDYRLSGTVYQQAERVGRSVPPMMMRAIASAVAVVLQNSKVNNSMGFGAHNG